MSLPETLQLWAPRYWPTWLGLGLLRLLTPLPLRWQQRLGRWLGRLAHRLPLNFVRIVRCNLALCLPQLEPSQREQLLTAHFENIGMALLETGLAWWASDQRIQQFTQVQGWQHLQAAQAQGRGVILLSAHFTTLEIGARAMAARLPLNVMYRPTSNLVMTHFLARNRALRTRRAIPRDDVRSLIGALKANEVVWYAPDQSYRKKGAQMVPLFGIPCATNTATSRLAKMTGAVVLPYFPERLADGSYRMTIQAPLQNFPSDDSVADATRFHHLIEAHVQQVPAQYLWIHRRFKGLSEDYPDYYRKS